MFATHIPAVDLRAVREAEARMDGLVKPIGSLGELERIAVRLAGMTGRTRNVIGRKRVVVFAADNGVYEEGITPVPQAVTAVQTANMLRGICGINVLCRHAGSELVVVDVGVAADMAGTGVVDRKIRPGTADMARGPAMSRAEALAAMEVGREMAYAASDDGVDLLGVGEMGICNTSTSSAVLAALTGRPAAGLTGRGAGIDDPTLARKIAVIEQALRVNRPDPAAPIGVLHKVGGLDIAAMAGCFLGAAERRLPAVVDGFIAAVAALTAVRVDPRAREYLFASHRSQEPGFAAALSELGLRAVLDLDMRLGEGAGCPLAFFLIEAAARVADEMGTFAEAGIDGGRLVDIREGARNDGNHR